jgi:hypothetical protein
MRISDRLRYHYGEKSVFTDIDSIPPGSDFVQCIENEIDTADALLAIVGPHWLRNKPDVTSHADDDYVHLEIEGALKKKIKITPILVGGARMPKKAELPEAIRTFAKLNATPVDSGINFATDINRLVASFDQYFAQLVPPDNEVTGEPTKRRENAGPTRFIPEPATDFPHKSPPALIASLNAAYKTVPAFGFAIGASGIAALAALIMGFLGHPRASLIIFSGMVLALMSVTICALFISHRNSLVSRTSIAAIWITSLIFISFLALTATGVGLKQPASWAAALGYEVEDEICSNPTAAQEPYSCEADGDFVVVGIDLYDSDKVTLVIRDTPKGAPLHRIPPNSTDVFADQCNGDWCHVKCASIVGWSAQRFLKPRSAQLRPVIGTSPPSAEGLAIQSGPHRSCRKRGFVQNGRTVILHGCEPNPSDRIEWCRITYNGTSNRISGWVPQPSLELSK